MPYVTYNLCRACTAGREGQRSPWAKVAMETTSGCTTLLFAALTHLKAELSRISLCAASVLLLYFLTLLCSFSSLCFLSTHTHTDVDMQRHLHTCVPADTYMSMHSYKHTGQNPHPCNYIYGIHTQTAIVICTAVTLDQIRKFSQRTFVCTGSLKPETVQYLVVQQILNSYVTFMFLLYF